MTSPITVTRGANCANRVYTGPAWLWPLLELTESIDDLLPAADLELALDLEPQRLDAAVNLHGKGRSGGTVSTSGCGGPGCSRPMGWKLTHPLAPESQKHAY